jgi:rod shape-determining protein MreB
MSLFGKDIAVDLGTANTLVYVRGEGIVVNEPSIVTIIRSTNEIYAIGLEAKALMGKTPESYATIRPLKDGVIADFEATERMLRYFINKAHRPNFFSKPRIIVCVPSGVTTVERRAVVEAAEQAGARIAYLVEEPVAAAIGANMPVESPVGNIIVDIGGGTTEVAVISMGGIVVSKSIRIAGDEMDEAIVNYFRKEHNILLGQGIAEELKMEIGSAFPLEKEEKVEVNGRDLLTGLPRKVVITSQMVRKALEDPVASIIHAIQETLSATPPELSADIMERGIALTGGGSLLLGLSHRVSHDTNCPAYVVDQPLSAVVLGSGKCLEELNKYKDLISVYGR